MAAILLTMENKCSWPTDSSRASTCVSRRSVFDVLHILRRSIIVYALFLPLDQMEHFRVIAVKMCVCVIAEFDLVPKDALL
jgi:hypothetical protein